jgi:hypothetical protein
MKTAVTPSPRQVLKALFAELGPMTALEQAKVEGTFYGQLFRLTEVAGADSLPRRREFDPRYDLTAGELRAAGKVIDAKVPDCAWVPRHAMRMGEVHAEKGPGPRDVRVTWEVSFIEPFRWVEIEGHLE